MNSAFGVDHGEISKAEPRPRPTTAQRLGRFTAVNADRAGRAGRKVVTTTLSVEGTGRATGRGTEALGRGITSAGKVFGRHPGKTGSLVFAGAGAAGVSAYKHARNQPPKVKAPRGM